MKRQLAVPKSGPLADFLPTITITAKNLATEITNFNVRKQDLQGERSITREHVQNNKSIRDLLLDRGIRPEALPPEEDLKKLERRMKSGEKLLVKTSVLPPLPETQEVGEKEERAAVSCCATRQAGGPESQPIWPTWMWPLPWRCGGLGDCRVLCAF